MTLQVFTTSDADYGRYIKALITGEPGAGKTLLSSTFPNPFYASAEAGLMSIADRNIRGTKITDTKQLKELRQILAQEPKVRMEMLGLTEPVDTVVIDTVDEVQEVFIKERKESEKISALRVQDYGWLGDQMKGMIRGFRNLDMHVVFTCHMKDSKDDENGRLIYKPGLVGSTCDYIPGAVDLSLMLSATSTLKVVNKETRRVMERKLIAYPDNSHTWIKDRSGKLPPEMEINFTDDFDRMYRLIYGTTDEPLTVSAAPAGLNA